MTVISVNQHIQYLISRHDCVIVPKFGAFIARYSPARISRDGLYMHAPVREIGFNPDVNNNDGLLTAGIVRREGLTYEAACAAIDNQINNWNNELSLHGSFAIPRVGSFARDENGALIFEPAANGICNSTHYGLPRVTVRRPVATVLPEAGESPRHIRRRTILRRMRSVASVAASLAILVILAMTLTTPILSEMGLNADYAGFGVIRTVTTPASTVKDNSCTKSEPLTEAAELFLAIPDPTVATLPVTPLATQSKPAVGKQHNCYLIVGSFDTQRKAKAWIEQQNDPSLRILICDERVRVYADTGATVKEASRLKSNPDFNRRHPDAWVHIR